MKLKRGPSLEAFSVIFVSPLPPPEISFYNNGGFIQSGFSFWEQIRGSMISMLSPIVGGSHDPAIFFARLLFFFIVFSVVYNIIRNSITIFKNNKPASVIVSLAVSILAVRNMGGDNIIRAILLPYGTLATAIATFLPLLIYFYFVHTSVEGGFARRSAWFIYGVVFLLLWLSRPYKYLGNANLIYVAGIVFVALNILFDASIHQYFEMSKFNKARRERIKIQLAELADAINKATAAGMDGLAEDLRKKYERLARKL